MSETPKWVEVILILIGGMTLGGWLGEACIWIYKKFKQEI